MGAAQGRSRIFISYSRADLAFADQLVAGLERDGSFEVLIDRHSIAAGEDWNTRLGGLIAQADTVVFVLSPDSVASPICAWEADEAARLSKRIIPVLWRPADFNKAAKSLSALNAIPFDGPNAVNGVPRLVEALNSDLDWLREHTRLAERAAEWDGAGRGQELLLRGGALGAAQGWLARKPRNAPEPTELQRAYLSASEAEEGRIADAERQRLEELLAERARAEAAERARAEAAEKATKRTRVLALAALALAVVAGGAGVAAYLQRGVAVAAEQRAVVLGNDALISESRLIARAAEELRVDGYPSKAMALAWEVLPHDAANPERPLSSEALQVLREARYEHGELTVVGGADGRVLAVSPDGDGLLYVPDVALPRLWTLESGATWTEGAVLGLAGETLRSAEISRDGGAVIMLADDGSGRLWSRGADGIWTEAVMLQDEQPVSSAVFSPDGAALVTTDGAAVRVWTRGQDGGWAEAATLDDTAYDAVINANGDEILAWTGERLRHWTRGAGGGWEARVVIEHDDDDESLSDAKFSPDSRMIAVALHGYGEDSGLLNRADLVVQERGEDGAWPQTVRLSHDGPIGDFEFTVDGTIFAASGEIVLEWFRNDEGTWVSQDMYVRHTGDIASISLGLNGYDFVTTASDNTARMSGRVLGPDDAGMTSAVFSADGLTIVTIPSFGGARIWPLDGEAETDILEGHASRTHYAEFSRDGTRLATSEFGAILLWSRGPHGFWTEEAYLRDQYGEEEENSDEDLLLFATFSPDGESVVTTSASGAVRLWTRDRDGFWAETTPEHFARSEIVARFGPDGSSILTAMRDDDGVVRLWSRGADGVWAETAVLPGSQDETLAASLSPDGDAIAVVEDQQVHVWGKTPTGDWTETGVLRGHEDEINLIAFNAGGDTIATASDDYTARLWTRGPEGSWTEAGVLGFESWIPSVAFGGDGNSVVAGSRDGTARIWRREPGGVWEEDEVVQADVSLYDEIYSVALSPKGDALVLGLDDPKVQLWVRGPDGAWAKTMVFEDTDYIFSEEENLVLWTAFSPDGSTFVTTEGDGAVVLRPVWRDPAQLIAESGEILARLKPLTREECAHYYIVSEIVCTSASPE